MKLKDMLDYRYFYVGEHEATLFMGKHQSLPVKRCGAVKIVAKNCHSKKKKSYASLVVDSNALES